MARTLSQIVRELDKAYVPQVRSIQKQQKALPGYFKAQEAGLSAQKDQAFGDILAGARQRGLGFAGIPLAEQAQYTATEFLPALAGLKQNQNTGIFGLTEAINKIRETQRLNAEEIRQKELDRDLQREQFAQQMRLARSSGGSGGGGSGASGLLEALLGGGGDTGDKKAPKQGNPVNDVFNIIKAFRQNLNNRQGGWGAAAQYLQKRGIPVQRGSAADIALNRYFNAGGLNDYLNALKREGKL